VVRYLRDVSAVLHLRSLATGTLLQAVRLPGLGSVEVSGRRASPILHFSYNSLTEPGAIYTCVLRPAWACPGRLGTLDTSGRAHCAGAGLCAAAAPGTASMQRAAQRDRSCSWKSSPVDCWARDGSRVPRRPALHFRRVCYIVCVGRVRTPPRRSRGRAAAERLRDAPRARRMDTSRLTGQLADLVHAIVLPGGYNLDDYETSQARRRQPPPGTEAAAPVRQAPVDAARLPSVQRSAGLRGVCDSGRCGVALAAMRQGRACRVGSCVRPCPTPGRGRGQVFVVSSDGAQVPMFIVAPINITLDGNNPTMLYGYGGAPSCPRRPCEGARQLCMLCERCVIRCWRSAGRACCAERLVGPRLMMAVLHHAIEAWWLGCLERGAFLGVCQASFSAPDCTLHTRRLPEDGHALLQHRPPGIHARIQRRVRRSQHPVRPTRCWATPTPMHLV